VFHVTLRVTTGLRQCMEIERVSNGWLLHSLNLYPCAIGGSERSYFMALNEQNTAKKRYKNNEEALIVIIRKMSWKCWDYNRKPEPKRLWTRKRKPNRDRIRTSYMKQCITITKLCNAKLKEQTRPLLRDPPTTGPLLLAHYR